MTFSQVTVTVPPISPPQPLRPRPLPTPPESPGLVLRKLSFAPPQFEETAVTVIRVSVDPDKDDVIQRVNSVSSSLNVQLDPTSDNLPLGGRRISVASLYSTKSDMQAPRRLNVRRVSAGGAEDVVDIPCAQPETALEAEEIVHTPASAPPPIPQLDPPPSARSSRKHRRPYSITITLKATPDLRSAPLNTAAATKSAVEPTTGTPYSATSPWTGFTADHSAGVVFEAWRGFPTARTDVARDPEVEGICSTQTELAHSDEGSKGNLTGSTNLSVPVLAERPRSATLPRKALPEGPKRLSLQSLSRKSPSTSPTIPKTQNKVTYLSDLVKELEENPHLRLTQSDLGQISSLSHLTRLLKVEVASQSPPVPPEPRISPLPPVIPIPDGLSATKDTDLSSDFTERS